MFAAFDDGIHFYGFDFDVHDHSAGVDDLLVSNYQKCGKRRVVFCNFGFVLGFQVDYHVCVVDAVAFVYVESVST